MKKSSIYNTLVDIDGLPLLFNAATDKIILFTPDLFNIYNQHIDHPESLASIHNELYQGLIDNGMLVDIDTDEPTTVIERWKQQDNDERYFQIIINPTLQCNLRCWYCYENHDAKTIMTDKVRESVCNFIKSKVSKPSLQTLSLSFFGGEPLIYYKDCVKPILHFASKLCEQHNKKLTISFTTNGVLITPTIINYLQSTCAESISFQITLDGNRLRHNNIRFTSTHKGTYDIILQHIKSLVAAKLWVNVRCNYTEMNYNSFSDIIEDLANIPDEHKKYLIIDFHKVWQSTPDKQAEDVINHTRRWFENEGIKVEPEARLTGNRCYADKNNCVVINYDGSLFKCTARDFSKISREGQLFLDGSFSWNDRFNQRMAIKYGNTTCQNCSIFPICHGGCSQDKLESNNNVCIRHYSDSRKQEIIEGHIMSILKLHNEESPRLL